MAELERIAALDRLHARDARQKRRFSQIAERARKLQKALGEGVPRREAQAMIAELRDEIGAERLRLFDRENRPGLEAAISKLNEDARLSRAARALGDGDLTEFDREMRELARRIEAKDRELVRKLLEQAAHAARSKGAPSAAKLLDQQNQKLGRDLSAESLSELTRDLYQQLSRHLDPKALEDFRSFEQTGNSEAQRRLLRALENALEGLSEAERQRLAENLAKRLSERGRLPGRGIDARELEQLSRRLSSEQGKEALRALLKQLADEPSDEVERDRELADRERDAERAQQKLRGAMPVPRGQGPQKGQSASGSSSGAMGGPSNGPNAQDEGAGQHGGKTDQFESPALRAKAAVDLTLDAPMYGASLGNSPAAPGETAKSASTQALQSAAPRELRAVERSELPQAYRDQVSRYFEP
jgi:hypothetical protein